MVQGQKDIPYPFRHVALRTAIKTHQLFLLFYMPEEMKVPSFESLFTTMPFPAKDHFNSLVYVLSFQATGSWRAASLFSPLFLVLISLIYFYPKYNSYNNTLIARPTLHCYTPQF
jgi:hypothetical protein